LPEDRARYRDPSGVPTFGRGIFSLINIQLGKLRNLSTSNQRIDVDRMVACSIWSPNQGITIPQRCRDYSRIIQGLRHGTIYRLRQGPRLWVVFQSTKYV
jgi:hypothetical protein